jgi:amino acid adenylation domain-containing protein
MAAATIHALVEAWAEQAPERPAVSDENGTLRYRELIEAADVLAGRLRAAGIRRGDRVAVCLGRERRFAVAALAVLKTGAAYVPLDPRYPDRRLAELVAESAAAAVVTTQEFMARFRAAPRLFRIDDGARSAWRRTAAGPRVGGADLAYVIFTSGSTGRPKGVMIEHRNVVGLLTGASAVLPYDERDVWTVFHSFSFDFSVWEFFGALTSGAQALVVPFRVSRNPAQFLELLERERVTVLSQTPSAFRALVAVDDGRPLSLQTIVFGGEPLDAPTVRRWKERRGDSDVRLVNMYGITETTVHITHWSVDSVGPEDTAGALPLGEPLPGMRVAVADEWLEPVDPGVVGELWVGGIGVGRGYAGRPALTAQRFVPDLAGGGARMYRSGDLGRRGKCGRLEFVGRTDAQVKVRGFRIDPGEVEAALRGAGRVRDVVVVVRDDVPGGQQLVAYVAGEDLDGLELRVRAKELLPEFMVPGWVVVLDWLPMTANGKVDQAALPPPPGVTAPRSGPTE